MKILLIDDSKLQRWAVQRILTGAGYGVTAAADGEEGLRMAQQGPHDLILLDMMLPKVDGPAVLASLKQDAKTAATPVIVMTGLSQKNESKLMEAGAAAFYQKSELGVETGTKSLLDLIHRVLREFSGAKKAVAAAH